MTRRVACGSACSAASAGVWAGALMRDLVWTGGRGGGVWYGQSLVPSARWPLPRAALQSPLRIREAATALDTVPYDVYRPPAPPPAPTLPRFARPVPTAELEVWVLPGQHCPMWRLGGGVRLGVT